MVREFRWRLAVRSYEGDAWGLVPAPVILRYLEQSAVLAAADAGYDRQFHETHSSAWVVRRMTLIVQAPARPGDELQIVTWASHFTRVRGVREYLIGHANGGPTVGRGIAEWVYLDRRTLSPLPIPAGVGREFDVPGQPLGHYEPPPIRPLALPPEFTMQRTAEWHEADSMRHINNAVYVEWLGEALWTVLGAMGWPLRALMEMGLQLRGEYYNIDYKHAAVPEDTVVITTAIQGLSDRLCAVRHTITGADGQSLLSACCVYGWCTSAGQPADPPPGWLQNLL